jgi:hypothetical protein
MSCANSDETRLLLSDDNLETQRAVKAKATPLPLVQLGGKHHRFWRHTYQPAKLRSSKLNRVFENHSAVFCQNYRTYSVHSNISLYQ